MEEPVTSRQSENFPDKPVLQQKSQVNSWRKSLWSIFLFMAAFYFFFDQNLQYLFLVVVVLLVHEFGHFVAMRQFQYKEVKMFFIPLLGALVTGRKEKISQRQRAIILLAGPVPGIIIGFVLYWLSRQNESQDLEMMGVMFLLLNLFNLLPLTPLDGGHLIGTLFFSKRKPIRIIFTILSAIGLAVIAIYLKAYILLVIPLFLGVQVYQQSRFERAKTRLQEEGIDYQKTYEELSDREYWRIRAQIIPEFRSLQDIDPNHYEYSDQEKSLVTFVKSVLENPPIQDLGIAGKVLFLGIWILFLISPLLGLVWLQFNEI